jgi:DHA1 family bicyclomycin/chloramphenicol resistance-like MFS transporter
MIGWGCTGAAASGLALAALVWSGHASIATILGPLALYFLSAALVVPNATAAAIMPFPRMAGAASALVGFVQMTMGAIAGWLVAILYDGSARSLATLVPLSALAAWAGFHWLTRTPDRPFTSRTGSE